MDEKVIRKAVRERYAIRAQEACCSGSQVVSGCSVAEPIKLGLGRPAKEANLRKGETVLDLGSGAGGDVIEASKLVGSKGLAIGVDSTPEMIMEARENARARSLKNVEFRLGEIEHLPIDSESIDVIISDCVINLSPDKTRVFNEAFRVLRPGGRIVISDVVTTKEIPGPIRKDPNAWAGCVAGAIKESDYHALLKQAGLEDVATKSRDKAWLDFISSAVISARKPNRSDPKTTPATRRKRVTKK